MRTYSFVLVVPAIVGLVFSACSSGNAKTPDGGTIYTSTPPTDIPCNLDTDCCVAIDQCHSVAYVVHAGDSLQIPQTNCNLCIAPPVQVWCDNGKCTNAVLPFTSDTPQALMTDHCGPVVIDAGVPPTSDSGAHGCQ